MRNKKQLTMALTLALTLGSSLPAWAAEDVYGGQVESGDISGQNLSLNGQTAKTVYGGYTGKGNATNNTISITDGTADFDEAYAGYTKEGDATGNQFIVSGKGNLYNGDTNGSNSVYGAITQNGKAKNNVISIESTGKCWQNMFMGAQADGKSKEKWGAAEHNRVSLISGDFTATSEISAGTALHQITLYGASVTNGNAVGNEVFVGKDAKFDGIRVTGGEAKWTEWNRNGNFKALANDNIVHLQLGDKAQKWMLLETAIGGESLWGDASGNQVIISYEGTGDDPLLDGWNGIYGGKTNWGSAENNRIDLRGGTFVYTDRPGAYFGGYAIDQSDTHETDDTEFATTVSGNTVSVTGTASLKEHYADDSGYMNFVFGGVNFIDGIITDVDEENRKVTVEGGSANENQVLFCSSRSSQVRSIVGGAGAYLTARNLVSILDSTLEVKDNIAGGASAFIGKSYSDNMPSFRRSEGNGVNLANASITAGKGSDVFSVFGTVMRDEGIAKDNFVNLSGKGDFAQADLYGVGQQVKREGVGDDNFCYGLQNLGRIKHSGNTLNVGYIQEFTTDENGERTLTGRSSLWQGGTIHGLYNFDKVAFYQVNGDTPALTVTDAVNLPKPVLDDDGKEGELELDLDHFVPTLTTENQNIVTQKKVVLIDASKASTVEGLKELYESGDAKYNKRGKKVIGNYGKGVTVEGTAKLSLENKDKVLYCGLDTIDRIDYGTIDWKTDGTVLTIDKDSNFDLTNTEVHTEDIDFTADSLARIAGSGDYAMTLLDTQGKKLTAGNLTTKQGKWNVGNALEGTGEAALDDEGNVIYKLDTVDKPEPPKEPEAPEKPVTPDEPNKPEHPQKPAIKVKAVEQTHNALMANEAGLGMLAAGRDRMEGVLAGFDGQEGGVFTFASVGGSKDTYDTGSESTAYTWNGLVGIGNEAALPDGDLSYGLFYEYGRGHYDVDGAGYAGTGDAHYNGGGLMAKYTAKNKNYVEGSLHFGQLKNNADSVLHGKAGDAYGYRTSSNYWSGHVGFGHVFDLTNDTASMSLGGTPRATRDLDVYGKYFYTHLGGDSFRVGEADYRLDSLNSSLLRLGARMNHRSGWNNYYYGLAWDYEFDGESNGTVSAAGLSAKIRKADIGGSSLMAEAGWKLEANRDNPWEVSLSTQAYAGQHKGIGGNVYMAYHF